MNSRFDKKYLALQEESKAPASFTPEALLQDAVKKCYWFSEKTGAYHIYTLDEILKISQDDLPFKNSFSKCIQKMKHENDFCILLFYFKDPTNIENVLKSYGYVHPMDERRFSNEVAFKQIQKFFADGVNKAANFNSIDVDPSLGCIIGVNGQKVKDFLEFEKELDHELNHYFEQIGLAFGETEARLADDKIKQKDEEILNVLCRFYGLEKSGSLNVENLRKHFFDDLEFRSMCANAYHDIIMFNMSVFAKKDEMTPERFFAWSENPRIDQIPRSLIDSVLFAWTVRKISSNRWNILREGIIKACEDKKNIFQKFWRKSIDWFRNIIK